ncbi:MAG TPA: hypothetical protein VFF13_00265 [archaeon]|nr:hypothetical protein [archaeon]
MESEHVSEKIKIEYAVYYSTLGAKGEKDFFYPVPYSYGSNLGAKLGTLNFTVDTKAKDIHVRGIFPFENNPGFIGKLYGSVIYVGILKRMKAKFKDFTIHVHDSALLDPGKKFYKNFGIKDPTKPISVNEHFVSVRDYLKKKFKPRK